MQRVRGANENSFGRPRPKAFAKRLQKVAPVLGGKLAGASRVRIAHRDEIRFRQGRKGGSMEAADFPTTDQCGANALHWRSVVEKYSFTIFRRNARDSAISSMPFIPSSMLIHP